MENYEHVVKLISDTKEKTHTINYLTIAEQKNICFNILSEYTDKDTSGIIVDFVVGYKTKGSIIDVCDNNGCWYPAVIIHILEYECLVHFVGWSSWYDEQIRLNSKKIQPFGTYTKGHYHFHDRLPKILTINLSIGNLVTIDFCKGELKTIITRIKGKTIIPNWMSYVIQGNVIYKDQECAKIQDTYTGLIRVVQCCDFGRKWRLISKKEYTMCHNCANVHEDYFCEKCGHVN